jgi:hypothetical protein
MMFCCDLLSENILEAGRKGFSIIPCKMENEDSYYFILQCRSADYKDNDTTVFISQRTINHCPWCGSKLSDIIKFNKIELDAIAWKNEYLIV